MHFIVPFRSVAQLVEYRQTMDLEQKEPLLRISGRANKKHVALKRSGQEVNVTTAFSCSELKEDKLQKYP